MVSIPKGRIVPCRNDVSSSSPGRSLRVVLPVAARAHHGWAWAEDEEFTLTGVIRAARLGNPHGELDVEAADGMWIAEIGQPWRNEQAGLTEDMLAPGVEVTLEGHRSRDPGREGDEGRAGDHRRPDARPLSRPELSAGWRSSPRAVEASRRGGAPAAVALDLSGGQRRAPPRRRAALRRGRADGPAADRPLARRRPARRRPAPAAPGRGLRRGAGGADRRSCSSRCRRPTTSRCSSSR